MFKSFQQAMTWLHTWFGLVLGFVLVVVFFFGSLSVFDREIDRWAIPESRFPAQALPSFDQRLAPIFQRILPEEKELAEARARVGGRLLPALPLMTWQMYTTHRDPVLDLYAEFAVENNPKNPTDHVHGHVTIDPRSGKSLPHDQLKIGSEFFYPMHFGLHLGWMNLGIYLVGLAALMMLVALVSGVVIHRKLFRELFTFRPSKNTQRGLLDLHNLTGVVALPFHVMFPLTGLIIFAGLYFPVADVMFKSTHDKFERIEAEAKGLAFEPSGKPGMLASVDSMIAEAKRRWAARGMPGEVGYLYLNHVGDAACSVSIYRAGSDRVTLVGQAIHFEGVSGRVIHEEPPASAVGSINEYLTGLHLQHFRHWLLRWLYVFGGLSGCFCIATGLVFFVNKRKLRHASEGVRGARWVDALAVTAVTGMLVATLAILVANRVLPAHLPARGDWQQRTFWLAWLAALVHASVRSYPVQLARPSPAWREQCWAIVVLALAAVGSNWVTTGDHLLETVREGYWPVAGLDLSLLCTAAFAALAARRLGKRRARPSGREADGRSELG